MIAEVETFLAEASGERPIAQPVEHCKDCRCQDCDPLPGWCTACGEVDCVCPWKRSALCATASTAAAR